MKLAIIADDLTGANDSGVQLARHGLKTTVLFGMDEKHVQDYDAVVFDTDSRSLERQEAYDNVKEAAVFLKRSGFSAIFKKLDSTMRGNIGAEIDALYEAINPDLVMIAPGYPKNGRSIIDSVHYLKGIPLGETEISKDPKTPVTQSYLPELIGSQTGRPIGTITISDLEKGKDHVKRKLSRFAGDSIPYILIDSSEEQHLKDILDYTKDLELELAWAGSAGIANYLPDYHSIPAKDCELAIPDGTSPVLTVIGSVNKNSRLQLKRLLEKTEVHAISFDSYKAVSDDNERAEEIRRIYQEAIEKAACGKDVVIYSTAEKADIEKAWSTGESRGLTHTQISNEIVKAIGTVCSVLLEKQYFKGVTMTGGDTAKQICNLWDVQGFELLEELETGVPISRFLGNEDIYVITKAGGFGSEDVLIHAMKKLKGEMQR
ncbi:four-carbon acid sugar kinase family protein [Peribacillus sp. SI8-4]|uniref:four-carbon acid sugar kinase family protein n=1 Tax=Peribacillus sp. SI8-4 TaxID=3048009 RepID=UPI002553914F|nr:four-carbon acid sugar kinase family protein [Peribacillus sp. SI8-4]